MKSLPFIFLGVVTLGVATAAAGDAPWKEYTWKEGKCTLLLPRMPAEMKNRLQVLHGEGIYLAHFHDTPDLAKAEKEEDRRELVKKALSQMRETLLKAQPGKLLREKALTLEGGHPGLELEIDRGALGVYRVRMYQVGPRFYQLILNGPRALTSSKDAEKFLGSLKLTK